VISPTQRNLPDNKQYSQQTDIHAPGGIRTRNPSRWATADRAATTKFPLLYKTRSYFTLFTKSSLLHTLFLSEYPWYCTSFSKTGFTFTIIEEKSKYIFSIYLYLTTRAAHLVNLDLITLITELFCAPLNILPHSKVQTQNRAQESHRRDESPVNI